MFSNMQFAWIQTCFQPKKNQDLLRPGKSFEHPPYCNIVKRRGTTEQLKCAVLDILVIPGQGKCLLSHFLPWWQTWHVSVPPSPPRLCKPVATWCCSLRKPQRPSCHNKPAAATWRLYRQVSHVRTQQQLISTMNVQKQSKSGNKCKAEWAFS